MSKKNKKHDADAKALKKLEKALRDPDLGKKARKKLEAELDALKGGNVKTAKPEKKGKKSQTPAEVEKIVAEALEASEASDPVDAIITEAQEVAAAGERHLAHLKHVAELAAIVADPKAKKKAKTAAEFDLQALRNETLERMADDRSDAREVALYNELEKATGGGHFFTADDEKAERDAKLAAKENPVETDAEIKARVKAKRAAREAEGASKWVDPKPYYIAEDETRYSESEYLSWDEDSTPAQLAVLKYRTREEYEVEMAQPLTANEKATIEGKKPKKTKVSEVVAEVQEKVAEIDATVQAALADPEEYPIFKGAPTLAEMEEYIEKYPNAPQPRDRWDRPWVFSPDATAETKARGYRRTTTYIDVLDDKSSLTTWGKRVVLAGVSAIEQKIAGDAALVNVSEVGTVSVLERVSEANRALAKGVKKANRDHAAGKIDADALSAAHDGLEKAHKAALDELVEEAYRAGNGFVKAETGTRLHALSEVADTKGAKAWEILEQEWGITDSERRDLEAYQAALGELNVEIKAVEQFVVVDDLEVGGTLDRRITYDSPTLGKRITAIGDLKTGRVDFGAGKMTRQLSIYQKGRGYDWRKPTERVTFRTNPDVGVIFHLAAGSGVCEVYEIDLKKGWEGVQLCAKVYAHRSETTTAKVFTKVVPEPKPKKAAR